MKKLIIILILFITLGVINVNARTLSCDYTMSYGSTGTNVKALQEILNRKVNCKLTIDGSFGPKTEACVKKYQKYNNLQVDGIVGINTCSKLVGNKVVRSSGNDKIVVDISDQKLYFYKGNNIVINTNVITGLKGYHNTPTGTYTLYVSNKARKVTLRGYNDDGSKYASYVEYWMPFYSGYGFHDADGWRSYSEYNKDTYKYNGSHGCVNMKRPDAEMLYNNLTKNTKVIIKK